MDTNYVSGNTIAERRARLVVCCACDLLGIDPAHAPAELHVPLAVVEFEQELRKRFGESHAELVFRTDSTLERARLDRHRLKGIPKVVLRQGAPCRSQRLEAAMPGMGLAFQGEMA